MNEMSLSKHHTSLTLATVLSEVFPCFHFLIKGLKSTTWQNEQFFSDGRTQDGLRKVEVPFTCMNDPTQISPFIRLSSNVMPINVGNINPIHGILFSQGYAHLYLAGHEIFSVSI
jgi:hypothetical protein